MPIASFRTPLRCAEPESELLGGKITGTGAATPTESEGCAGFAVTWVSTGLYEVTFGPAVLQVWPGHPSKWADTITGIDGWDVVFGQYNATTRKIRFSVVNESNTLSDLAALTGLNLSFQVKLTATRG